MSIETRIPQEGIDIKQLNIEQPEQGDVYFDEKKMLSDAIWQKFNENLRAKLDKYLAEPDPKKRDLNLRSYASQATDYYFLSAKKARELPTDQAISDIKDAEIRGHLASGRWFRVVGLMFNYLASQPAKLNEIKLSEEQYRDLIKHITGEFKHNGESKGDWDDYLFSHLLLKHLYPNEPAKWLEVPPETLKKATEDFYKEDGGRQTAFKTHIARPSI